MGVGVGGIKEGRGWGRLHAASLKVVETATGGGVRAGVGEREGQGGVVAKDVSGPRAKRDDAAPCICVAGKGGHGGRLLQSKAAAKAAAFEGEGRAMTGRNGGAAAAF